MSSLARSLLVVTSLFAVASLAEDAPSEKPPEKKTATKSDYTLDVSATAVEGKVKSDLPFSLVIAPVEGLKVHPQAPLEVKLKTTDGLKAAKPKLGRADVKSAEAKSPELVTTLHASAAGKQEVEASVSFFLCSPSWCQRMTDKVVVAVNVTN